MSQAKSSSGCELEEVEMHIKNNDKLNVTLSEIDFTSKKTFIMGGVNSGKTNILAKILSDINKTTKTLFIGTASRLEKLYPENQPDCRLLDSFSDKTIIDLGEYTKRRISEDYEVEKKEVILESLDYQFVVHDELFKPSESINNIFSSSNKRVGYITEVHVGQNVMLGFVESDLEDAVVFLYTLLAENNLIFDDVPELQVILLEQSHIKNTNNKIELTTFVNYYTAGELSIKANRLKVDKPEIFRKRSFNERNHIINIRNKAFMEELKGELKVDSPERKAHNLLEECLKLSMEWGLKIGLDNFPILKSINIISCDGKYLHDYYQSKRDIFKLIEDAEKEITIFKKEIEKYQLLI